MNRPLTAIDLFAGAGGLSLGLHRAGFDVIAAVDSWQHAVDTHTRNLPHAARAAGPGARLIRETSRRG